MQLNCRCSRVEFFVLCCIKDQASLIQLSRLSSISSHPKPLSSHHQIGHKTHFIVISYSPHLPATISKVQSESTLNESWFILDFADNRVKVRRIRNYIMECVLWYIGSAYHEATGDGVVCTIGLWWEECGEVVLGREGHGFFNYWPTGGLLRKRHWKPSLYNVYNLYNLYIYNLYYTCTAKCIGFDINLIHTDNTFFMTFGSKDFRLSARVVKYLFCFEIRILSVCADGRRKKRYEAHFVTSRS